MKVVKPEKALLFDCPECGETQYRDYTLCPDWYDDRAVNADVIDCEKCGKEIKLIEEN